MAKQNFDGVMACVFAHEGGYVDDPQDRGGATNMGITFGVLQAYRGHKITKNDVKCLTKAEATAIYRKQYWDAVKGDDLRSGLDYAMFDFAVNSGAARAIKTLQNYLGVKPDGVLGMLTFEALRRETSIHKTIDALCDARLAFMKKTYGWKRFGKGWARRVYEVRRIAHEMAKGADTIVEWRKEAIAPEPTVRADQEIAPLKTPEGKVAIYSTAAALGTAATTAAEQIQPLADISPMIKYIFLGLTIVGVFAGLYSAITAPKEAT